MYEKLIEVANFNKECSDILYKLHEPLFKLVQRNGRKPYFNYKEDVYHLIDIHGKEKIISNWHILFKLCKLYDRIEYRNKYLSSLELIVCFLGYFSYKTNFYEMSEEIKGLPRLRKYYYEESQEEVDKLEGTMKKVQELLLDLHRAMTAINTLSDEV